LRQAAGGPLRADLIGRRKPPICDSMNTLVSILSQLFWGVTAGALMAAVTTIGQFAAMAGGVFGAGYLARRWRGKRGKKD